jgi:GNAT superfamily N-acetyltransferase
MPDHSITMTDQPARADVDFIEERINEYNIAQTGRDDGQELALFIRDESGEIVGGLYGWTWAGWFEVRYLWLREDLRGQRHGTQLLQAAEEEAARRGCTRVYLDSYSFQAPGFYKKLGYQEFGVLPGFPDTHTRHFLWKTLTSTRRRKDAEGEP